jgi:spore coat protein U-like protein
MKSMTRRRRLRIACIAALAAGAVAWMRAQPSDATSATSSLTVSATVVSNCVIQTDSLDFGIYDPMLANATTPRNASANVTLACTRGSSPSISMDLGQHESSGSRYMRITTAGLSDSLRYELYQPASPAAGSGCSFPGIRLWGVSPGQTFTPMQPPSRAARSYSVCGTIPAGQGVSMGAYADTVVATVNF